MFDVGSVLHSLSRINRLNSDAKYCGFLTEPTKTLCNLLGLEESIVSIIAFDPTKAALFGVDHKMNFHRSTNDGVTWEVISSQYFYNLKKETSLIMSTGIPENMVTATPSSFWSATSSSGKKWGGW